MRRCLSKFTRWSLSMETSKKTALLLINTGSPDQPTETSVRSYLAEFLGDQRIVELPRWKWWPILHGIILRTRPKKSAARYNGVWTDEGSPLIVHTKHTAEKLTEHLGIPVYWGMRYGHPSVTEVMDQMMADGVKRVLVMPMFAQYAAQTTAACFDAVARHVMTHRDSPAIRTIHDYHDEPAYIQAIVKQLRHYWDKNGAPMSVGGRLVMSFHGIPQKSSELGDVYEAQCHKTASLIANELGLDARDWTVCFQSRFGRDEWLQPYTLASVKALDEEGTPRVDVICPGFAADCLETIEEIDDELRRTYMGAFRSDTFPTGEFHYIPALNESDFAIEAYEMIARRELAGWL